MREKAPKPERIPVVIDEEDIREAQDRIFSEERIQKLGRRDLRPDDSILADEERTPSEAAAKRDFALIQSSLKQVGVDLMRARTLEVGSGMGELLKVLKEAGVDVTGIDDNPREYYRPSRGGYLIEYAPLEALKPEKAGLFQVILARDVFDNDRYKLQVYKEMLAHIDTLLPSGGIFMKMGTGVFTKEEIPEGWERVGSYNYDIELYRKA